MVAEHEAGMLGTTALDAEDQAVRRAELAARMAEAQQKLAAANAPWWRGGANSLTLAIAAGAITLLGNIGLAAYNGYTSLQQEKAKADATLAAEKEKNKAALILQAVSTNDPETARRNVLFFVDSGFFEGQADQIKQALELHLPVLPSSTGTAPALPASADDYEKDFWLAKINNVPAVDKAVEQIMAGKEKFDVVAQQTSTPWYIIAVIWREESADFNTHLVNGDPLTSRTTNVPVGRPLIWPPPNNQDRWVYSAIDAIKFSQLNNTNTLSLGNLLQRVERFNGTGYRVHGLFSPYLWSSTDLYTKGNYVAAGRFDPNATSELIGVVALLRRMHELEKIRLQPPGSASVSTQK